MTKTMERVRSLCDMMRETLMMMRINCAHHKLDRPFKNSFSIVQKNKLVHINPIIIIFVDTSMLTISTMSNIVDAGGGRRSKLVHVAFLRGPFDWIVPSSTIRDDYYYLCTRPKSPPKRTIQR